MASKFASEHQQFGKKKKHKTLGTISNPSFRKSSIINAFDGIEDNIVWKNTDFSFELKSDLEELESECENILFFLINAQE